MGALRAFGELVATSALYETLPVGPPQPDYLNAAVRLTTDLAPEPLLDALLGVERSLGRVRRERWGPRLIDLDVLWADAVTRRGPRLVLPHPRLAERAFALVPLVEVAPGATDPATGVCYAALAAGIDQSGIRRLPAAWLD